MTLNRVYDVTPERDDGVVCPVVTCLTLEAVGAVVSAYLRADVSMYCAVWVKARPALQMEEDRYGRIAP